jgi:hypothetical protein
MKSLESSAFDWRMKDHIDVSLGVGSVSVDTGQ